jgi:putative tricarboxylic transport membrane protein
VEGLHLLIDGFASALQLHYLVYATVGCLVGTLVGVLPGFGPSAAIAVLIPVTLRLDPTGSIIMLAAIYYGAMYGGTITSVLLRIPGEAASVVTTFDGYEMARRGRGGAALAISAIGSFAAGISTTFVIAFVAPTVASFALKFGPPEFFGLTVVGLSLVVGLSGRSLKRAVAAALLGLLVSMIGIDPMVGAPRFTFGLLPLLDGISIVPVAMGLFGVSEILLNIESPGRQLMEAPMRSLRPSATDLRVSALPIARGTIVGFLLGLIPGVSAMVATMFSYTMEKKVSKTPEAFGTGVIEGVAGPESANNAYAQGTMIPLLTLGIPTSPTMAVFMGALIINGIAPGPLLFQQQTTAVWTLIASLVIGNGILLILNLPLIPIWVSILRIRYAVLTTLILGFAVIGAYSLRNSGFDVVLMGAFGIVGYLLHKVEIPLAPMVLTFVLGPLMERALRQSLSMSAGSFDIFVHRPAALIFLLIAAAILIVSAFQFTGAGVRSQYVDDA